MKNNKTFKYVIEVISVIAAIAVCMMSPTDMLSKQALLVLGITLWGVINLVIGLFDSYVVGLTMCMLWFVSGAVPIGTAMAGFTSTTWWLIIGVMGLGAAVSKSGLLKRLSLLSLKFFKPTYSGQLLAIVIMGVCIAPLIPSTTAKCAIMGALVLGICDELGLPKRGMGRFGLLMALWLGFNISGNFFVNASFQGYMVLGQLPAETQEIYNWTTWFIRSLPWSVTVTVLYYLFIKFFYKETNTKEISKEYIDEQFKALGGFTRDEKIVAAVMAVCLVLFVFEQQTGIGSVVVAVLAMCALSMLKVIGPQEFVGKTLWPLIVFIGVALGMGGVFSAVGITNWLVALLQPIAQGLTNPYLFVIVICLITYVVRILVDQVSTNVLLVSIVIPLAQGLGMDPWIGAVIVYGCSVVFYPTYVHPNMLICYGAVGGEENVDIKHALTADIAYMVVCMIGFLISVPFWQMFGMI
ncbi:MAG: hypothetical protein E7191_00835 [Erysipelotrichaceae bacterium]|nr:hypothetical protein [Erysipelotrichaceae bacterium]